MSGLLAIIGEQARDLTDPTIDRMLRALVRRGDQHQVWRGDGALLAGTRFDWEMADGFAGRAIIACDQDLVVVVDASIYYREDLERNLRDCGVALGGGSAAHLVAAAYRAWGDNCPEHLEGDYAFIVYDRRDRCTFAARDFMGRRPLYFAQLGGTLVIASTVAAILEHPSCARDFDDVHLAELLCVSTADADRTPFSAVKSLPAASSLSSHGARSLSVTKYWRPMLSDVGASLSFDDAAEQLRELLAAAIVERSAREGPTVLWLSGGYDSPAIYGVGNDALDRRGLDRMRPVSFSYPLGDAARENELIEEIARFWNATPTWLSIADVPLLANATTRAAESDIPFQHAFENWLRALAAATGGEGCRVALQGDGGDQLFAVSLIFLQDLFSRLRWRELRREWRALGGHGARALWRRIVRPVISERLSAMSTARQPRTPPPAWVRRDFIDRHQLEAREAQAEALIAADARDRAGVETLGPLSHPVVPRVLAGISALALDHSIEVRTPLFDQRIVEFALSRPREERASDGAVKHLLRRAARGLLPPSVLAPRQGGKTGVLSAYFATGFRSDPHGVVSHTFEAPILAELGVVDATTLQQAWRAYKNGSGRAGEIFLAFEVELWLRARTSMVCRQRPAR